MDIRKYNSDDEAQVRKIHLETYLLGKPISTLTKKLKILSSEADYYINKEPENLFVVEDKGNVVGYLFGCLNEKNEPSKISFIIYVLFNVFKLPFMNKKERKFWKGRISFIFRLISGKSGELKLKVPENAGHIHINLLPEARGKGVGSKLLKEFFKYAKSKGTKVIHAGSFKTRLNPNSNFWIKNGFKIYDKVNSTFWKSEYPAEKIELVCYSKKL